MLYDTLTSICIFKCCLKLDNKVRKIASDNSKTCGIDEAPFFDNATQRYCLIALINISFVWKTLPAFWRMDSSSCRDRILDRNSWDLQHMIMKNDESKSKNPRNNHSSQDLVNSCHHILSLNRKSTARSLLHKSLITADNTEIKFRTKLSENQRVQRRYKLTYLASGGPSERGFIESLQRLRNTRNASFCNIWANAPELSCESVFSSESVFITVKINEIKNYALDVLSLLLTSICYNRHLNKPQKALTVAVLQSILYSACNANIGWTLMPV